MSARVYLFADFGKGPRVVHSWLKVWNDSWHGERRTNNSPRTFAEADLRSRIGSRVSAVVADAVPKWLVECESAAAGRECIASGRSELRSGFHGNGSLLVGRILDSGGAK